MKLPGGHFACSEDQSLWFRDRLTEKVTFSLEIALLYPEIIPIHAKFGHRVTHVRWTIADEPKASGIVS